MLGGVFREKRRPIICRNQNGKRYAKRVEYGRSNGTEDEKVIRNLMHGQKCLYTLYKMKKLGWFVKKSLKSI